MDSSSPIGVSDENLKEQTARVLRCVECNKPNPAGNRYCGQCGAELGHTLDETVRKRGFRDRQATEMEVTEAVAERLIKWVKWLGIIAAVPLTLFALALGKGYVDIRATVQEGKTDIATAVRQAKTDIDEVARATPGLKAQVAQLRSDFNQYEQVVSQTKSQSQELQRLQDRVNELNRNLDLSLAQARSTQQSLRAVTSVVAKSNSSTPLVSTINQPNFSDTIKINGFNFGAQQGHIYARLTSLSRAILPPDNPGGCRSRGEYSELV